MSDKSVAGVNVNPWGQGNDCWWNIAKEQLEQTGKSASAQEISQLVNQLQEYNKQKQSNVVRENDLLYDGEQIFLPLEYAIDEIKSNVETKTGEASTAQNTLNEKQSALTTATGNVSSTLSAYNKAVSAYNSAKSNAEDGETVDSSQMDAAKQAYLNALKEQEQIKAEVESAKAELETKKSELEQYKNELTEIQEEYAGEKSNYKSELDEIQKQLNAINDNSEASDKSLEQAKQWVEAAQKQQDSAQETLGVSKDDDGNYTIDEEKVTADALNQASQDTKQSEVKAKIGDLKEKGSQIIDGLKTYFTEKAAAFSDALDQIHENKETEAEEDLKEADNKGDSEKLNEESDQEKNVKELKSDINNELADFESKYGDYLKKSEYYSDLQDSLLSMKDKDGKTMNDEEWKKEYSKFEDFENTIKELEAKGNTGCTNLGYMAAANIGSSLVLNDGANENEENDDAAAQIAFQDFLNQSGRNLVQMYTDKVDSLGPEKAKEEMENYIQQSTNMFKAKLEADELYNEFNKNKENLTPAEQLIFDKNSYDDSTYAISFPAGTTPQKDSIDKKMKYYDGNTKYDNEINETIDMYNGWSDYYTNASNTLSKGKASSYEENSNEAKLIDLYNEFIEGHDGNWGLFDNSDDKKTKAYAESIILQLANGSYTENNIETAIRNLEARIKAAE